MKIVTWNVNSIRVRLPQVISWLKEVSPDVVLFQEIKCLEEAFPSQEFEDLGYNIALHGQKTYNGVAILSKFPLEDVLKGLPTFEDNTQARYIEAVTNNVRVASVYVPNGESVGSEKYIYKMMFLHGLLDHFKNLLYHEEKIVIGGDYNIAPEEEDVHDPVKWAGQILFSDPERAYFRSFLHLGYVDAVKMYHKKPPFSWWDYRSGAWQRGEGLRIDHLLLSPQAVDCSQNAGIDSGPRGQEKSSDHTPVWCVIKE